MVSNTFTCNLCLEHYSTHAEKRVLGFEHRTLTTGALDKAACHICISCLQALRNDLGKFDAWLKGESVLKPVSGTDEEALSVLGVNSLGVSVCAYENWQWDEDAITWAMNQGVFKAGQHAANSFQKLSKELGVKGGYEPKVLYKAWYEKVLDKMMKQPA